MPQNQPSSLTALISEARQRLSEEFRGQAEQLEKLEQGLQALRARQQQLQEGIERQLDALHKSASSGSTSSFTGAGAPLDNLLASVRNLITANLPEQVFAALAQEAEQMGVRAAVFDIRGKAAWGASARGFGPELSDKVFHALVVPLNKDNPFRQAYETGGQVDATIEILKKARNVLDKFNPGVREPILLLPIRSAGSVSAILYCDLGGKGKELPVDALKILSEFAGAQLDRLMALSGGLPGTVAEKEAVEAEPLGASEEPEPQERVVPVSPRPVAVGAPPSRPAAQEGGAARQLAPPAAGFDVSKLNEADQKVHKDASRFAKLLVSEIDLYNKPKVTDGRKNSDLYRRLKADIDRSRQTYEKRFGKTVAKHVDYFHEELVRTLAENEPSLLGTDYPGPTV